MESDKNSPSPSQDEEMETNIINHEATDFQCSRCFNTTNFPNHCLKCHSLFCNICTYKTFLLCIPCFTRLPEQTGTVADILEMQMEKDEDYLSLTARLLRAVGEFQRCILCSMPATEEKKAIGEATVCEICDETQQILHQSPIEIEDRITDTFLIFSKKRKIDHRQIHMAVQANDAFYVHTGDPAYPGPPIGTGNPYRILH